MVSRIQPVTSPDPEPSIMDYTFGKAKVLLTITSEIAYYTNGTVITQNR